MASSAIAGGASNWVLITFGAYLLVLLGVGLYATRFMDTVGDYVVGGRQIGPVVTGFSERASEMSGWLTLGVPSDAYSSGIMAFLNGLGMIPADLFSWAGIAKRLRKYSEIVRAVTLPTFFEHRLGDDTGRVKATSALVLLIFEGGYVGAQIVAAGELLEILTGMAPWIGILIGGTIVLGYTFLGGYFAVAWSDYVQGAIILLAFIALPIIAFQQFGLPFDELATAGDATVSITGGTTGWAAVFGIIGYAAIGLGVPGNPHIMVRFMGIDRVKNVRTAALVAQLFMFVAYIGAALVGLYAIVQFGGGAIENGDAVMPMLTLELFPSVIAGIILAAALAAMMSSADSQLLVATSAAIEDVYHGFVNEDATEAQLVRYARLATLGIGIASIAFAYFARNTSIYTLVLDYAWGGLGAAIGPTVIAALWWKRTTAEGAVASMITGAVTMVVWTQLPTLLGWFNAMPSESAGFWYGLVTVYGLFPAFVLSVCVLILVSLLTDPPEGVDRSFELFDKPLSAVLEDDRAEEFAPDGGIVAQSGQAHSTIATTTDRIQQSVLTRLDSNVQRSVLEQIETTSRSLGIVEPSISRTAVKDSPDEPVIAVAYPHQCFDVTTTIERPVGSSAQNERIVAVDTVRSIPLRADSVPEFTTESVDEVVVMRPSITDNRATEIAKDATFRWAMRKTVLLDTPEIEIKRQTGGYKLYWLVERNGELIAIDSVRGTQRSL